MLLKALWIVFMKRRIVESKEKMGNRKKELGIKGEAIALNYLKQKGYKIIGWNYRGRLGEIDIIAKDREYLCFIEVKTRSDNEKGSPEEAINRAKIRKISQNALEYIMKNNVNDCDMRFDVVAIYLGNPQENVKVNLIKNAFELKAQYFT